MMLGSCCSGNPIPCLLDVVSQNHPVQHHRTIQRLGWAGTVVRFILDQAPRWHKLLMPHRASFDEHGVCCRIAAERIDLLPLMAATADHLSAYSLMDISLDPFPYAGTTTTCESLFMGVPCLTLKGSCHAHNVGVSLLTAVGLESAWVAASEDQYVSMAVEASRSIPELASLRGALRKRMQASLLCNGPAFMQGLEQAYRRMWTDRMSCTSRKLS